MLVYKVPNKVSWSNSSTVQQWLGLFLWVVSWYIFCLFEKKGMK